jgi:hypothetical protein
MPGMRETNDSAGFCASQGQALRSSEQVVFGILSGSYIEGRSACIAHWYIVSVHAAETYGGAEVKLHRIFTSVLDGGE